MRICPANLLLISLSASDSFKRFSGEKNTSMMLSSFLTLPLLWFSFDMCGTFRLQDLWSVTLDFSWFALGLFRFWFSIGFCDFLAVWSAFAHPFCCLSWRLPDDCLRAVPSRYPENRFPPILRVSGENTWPHEQVRLEAATFELQAMHSFNIA